MRILNSLLLSISFFTLAACGGGSSGGAGGDGRTFSATGNVNVTPDSGTPLAVPVSFTITISGNVVTLNFPEGVSANATLDGSGTKFTVALFSNTEPGPHPLLDGVCDQPIFITGMIVDSSINGNVSGMTTCTVVVGTQTVSSVVTYNGQYTASEAE